MKGELQMGNNNQEETEIDLLELLYQFKKRLWIIVLAVLIAAAGSGLFTHYLIQPLYSSTSKLYILTSSTSITSLADIQIGTSLTVDYIQLVQSRPVVDQVIENLNLNRTYEELLEQMDFSNPSNSRILVITAKDPDPVLAKDIVDEFANVSKERISAIMKTEEPTVVEYGYMEDRPVSPSLKKNTAIGGLLGAVLAMGIIAVMYLVDDTVKTAEDVEKYLGLNTLTSVPLHEGEKKSRKKRIYKSKGVTNNGK